MATGEEIASGNAEETPRVTAEELSAAYDAMKDTSEESGEVQPEEKVEAATPTVAEIPAEKVEEKPVEEVKVDAPDNKENSRLGRNVAELKQKVDSLLPKLESIERLEALLNRQVPSTVQEEVPDYVGTADDVVSVLMRDPRTAGIFQDYGRRTYETEYFRNLDELGSANTDHQDVVELMGKPEFKSAYFDNPEISAKVNYANAYAEVLRKKLEKATTEKKIDRTKAPDVPSGVIGGASVVKSPAEPDIKLDEFAAEYAKSLGWDASKVSSVLGKAGIRR